MEARSSTQSTIRNSLRRQHSSVLFSNLLGQRWHPATVFELSRHGMGLTDRKGEIERITGEMSAESHE